jgi:ubiquinone/menaquinone biosynthesis C-methylase UbiE
VPRQFGRQAKSSSRPQRSCDALRRGDRILIFGEAVKPIGWDQEISDRVGNNGEVVVIDIRDRVLSMMREGKPPQWAWDETKKVADHYFDCVFVGQAVAHAGDWAREGAEMLRIMKPGRRLVLAEISLGATTFSRAHADVHLEYWLRKTLEGMQIAFDGLVSWDLNHLSETLKPQLNSITTFEWRGVELLWGRKPCSP